MILNLLELFNMWDGNYMKYDHFCGQRWICLLLIVISLPCAVCADEIRLRADSWAPFNGDPSAVRPGYIVEIAREVFSKAGHTVDYQIEPWARSVQQVESGQIEGLVGASPGDAPTLVYPEEHLGVISFGLFTAPGQNWGYSGIASLEGKRLGHITAYSYGDTLNAYIERNKSKAERVFTLTGDGPLAIGLKMLAKGRLDVLVSTPQVLFAELDLQKLDRTTVRLAGEMPEKDKIYIAFSPKNPKSSEYAKTLSAGIRAMRASGRLKQILSLYRLDDWSEKPAPQASNQ